MTAPGVPEWCRGFRVGVQELEPGPMDIVPCVQPVRPGVLRAGGCAVSLDSARLLVVFPGERGCSWLGHTSPLLVYLAGWRPKGRGGRSSVLSAAHHRGVPQGSATGQFCSISAILLRGLGQFCSISLPAILPRGLGAPSVRLFGREEAEGRPHRSPQPPERRLQRGGAGLLSRVISDRTRGNGLELCQ